MVELVLLLLFPTEHQFCCRWHCKEFSSTAGCHGVVRTHRLGNSRGL